MTDFSPREIVSELDRFIVAKPTAKRAVSTRWQPLAPAATHRLPAREVLPKNILMIVRPASARRDRRRLAKLAGAPFIKVEATKFTEVGYAAATSSRSSGISSKSRSRNPRTQAQGRTARAQLAPRSACSNALVGQLKRRDAGFVSPRNCAPGSSTTRKSRSRPNRPAHAMFEIPACRARKWARFDRRYPRQNGGRTKTRRLTWRPRTKSLVNEESDKLLDNDQLVQEAINASRITAIVFLDEIDKICVRDGRSRRVCAKGVQRDLLPLIEGTRCRPSMARSRPTTSCSLPPAHFYAKPSTCYPNCRAPADPGPNCRR